MVFHWSLSDSKSSQVSWTLLSILVVLNNAVIWMVSGAPIIIGITVTFMFHSFFLFSCKVQVFISLFAFFQFYPVFVRNGKVHYSADSLFSSLTTSRSSGMAEIIWSVCISESQENLCLLFSSTDSGLCKYYFFGWSDLKFLHNSQWIILLTQSCIVL